MEKEECWTSFLASGKVTDYLRYRQAQESGASGDGHACSAEKHPETEQAGSCDKVKYNAGFY